MKVLRMAAFVAVCIALAMPTIAAAADDGAAIYKSKCAMCHGPNGEGKMGPKLAGEPMTEAQIADQITKGTPGKKAPHAKPIAGLTADQANAVAAYVKSLK